MEELVPATEPGTGLMKTIPPRTICLADRAGRFLFKSN